MENLIALQLLLPLSQALPYVENRSASVYGICWNTHVPYPTLHYLVCLLGIATRLDTFVILFATSMSPAFYGSLSLYISLCLYLFLSLFKSFFIFLSPFFLPSAYIVFTSCCTKRNSTFVTNSLTYRGRDTARGILLSLIHVRKVFS